MSATVGSRIAMAIAVIALPLGMLSVWLGAYVADTDRYVQTVAPLGQDREVQQFAVDYLQRETLAVLDSGDGLGATIRTLDLSCIGVDSDFAGGIADLANAFLNGTALGNSLREQIRPQLEQTIRQAISQAVEGETFQRVWVQANRQAHQEILAALEDRPRPQAPADQVLLPLTEISAMISGLIACPNLITDETAAQIRSSFTLVNAEDLRSAHAGYVTLKAMQWVLPVLFVVAMISSLVLARSKWRVGWQLSAGFALGMGALKLGLVAFKSTITGPGVDESILDVIWDALTHSLNVAMIAVGMVALVAAILLWLVDNAPPAGQSTSDDVARVPLD